jgi:hypothetical protein
VGSRGESAILNEKVADVHRIVYASIQLMLGTKVVDANYESFSSRHDFVCNGATLE